MKKQHLQQNHKYRQAFTLIETVISLLIISVGIFMMGWFVNVNRKLNDANIQTTNFYLFINRFEDQHFKIKKCHDDELKIMQTRTNKEYLIHLDKGSLLLSNSTGQGYVPLMDNVSKVHWQYRHHNLSIQVTTMAGNLLQANSYVK